MKDVFDNSIFFSDATAVDRHRTNVSRLLLLIGEYMGWKGDISRVFVSDRSSVGDFNLKDSDVRDLSSKVGFKVKQKEYLHKIAARMVQP